MLFKFAKDGQSSEDSEDDAASTSSTEVMEALAKVTECGDGVARRSNHDYGVILPMGKYKVCVMDEIASGNFAKVLSGE